MEGERKWRGSKKEGVDGRIQRGDLHKHYCLKNICPSVNVVYFSNNRFVQALPSLHPIPSPLRACHKLINCCVFPKPVCSALKIKGF